MHALSKVKGSVFFCFRNIQARAKRSCSNFKRISFGLAFLKKNIFELFDL